MPGEALSGKNSASREFVDCYFCGSPSSSHLLIAEDDLTGKSRQEFAHGWLGLESFGRASVVAVTSITEAERAALVDILAFHFTEAWGAPHIDAARPVAEEEIAHMAQMCSDQAENTLMVIERELTPAGVKDRFRLIPPQGASLEAFAVHGD